MKLKYEVWNYIKGQECRMSSVLDEMSWSRFKMTVCSGLIIMHWRVLNLEQA